MLGPAQQDKQDLWLRHWVFHQPNYEAKQITVNAIWSRSTIPGVLIQQNKSLITLFTRTPPSCSTILVMSSCNQTCRKNKVDQKSFLLKMMQRMKFCNAIWLIKYDKIPEHQIHIWYSTFDLFSGPESKTFLLANGFLGSLLNQTNRQCKK